MERLVGTSGLRVDRFSPLARRTSFRIGGAAEVWCEVATAEALRVLQRACQDLTIPLLVLGRGANVLVPDSGLAGVVCRLTGDFVAIELDGTVAVAGAGVTLAQLAKQVVRRGLAGLEALAGFPASVGGAVVMNAGCYGVEIKDVLDWVEVVHPDGSLVRLRVADLDCGYRETNLRERGAIVVRACFQLTLGDAAQLGATMDELNRRRWAALPSGSPSAGSIFRNPPGDHAGRLIESCGLKGLAQGGARVSLRHGNVIVNEGGATAADVFELMVRIHREVRSRCGVSLTPELLLLGPLAGEWRAAVGDDEG